MAKKTPLPTIRALTLAEWEALMHTEESAWMLFDIAESDGDFLIVERGGTFLAYLQHQPHESTSTWLVLNRLETRPYYRRRGYARRLVERVMETSNATLIIARGVQSSSIGFWRLLGFEPDGFGPEVDQGRQYSEGNYVWKRPHTQTRTRCVYSAYDKRNEEAIKQNFLQGRFLRGEKKMKPLTNLRELKKSLQQGTHILQIWNGRKGTVSHMLTVTRIQTQKVETTCPDFPEPYWISFPNRVSVVFTEEGWIRMNGDQKMAEYVWGEKNYWIEKYEACGCIDLSEQEKEAHSAEEWREMVNDLIQSHLDALAEASAS